MEQKTMSDAAVTPVKGAIRKRGDPRYVIHMSLDALIRLKLDCIRHDERYKVAPCLECGANSREEGETMCYCSGDKDDCHGCSLWPND